MFWGAQNLANPQSLNSYSYAENNPINRSDPSGLKAEAAGAQNREIQRQINKLRSQVERLWTNLAVNAPSAAFGGALDPVSGYQTATNGSNPTSVRVGAGTGAVLGTVGTILAPGGRVAGGALVGRAKQVSSVLDPIAQSRRTTAVLRTAEGDIVAGGGRDLTASQIATLQAGEMAASAMPGAHAEVTALTQAQSMGSTPQMIGASRPICSSCQSFIQSTGGRIMNAFTAQW